MPAFPRFHEKKVKVPSSKGSGVAAAMPEPKPAPAVFGSNPCYPATPATPKLSTLSDAPGYSATPATRPAELHLEHIMALPLRPCTSCRKLQWHDREFVRDDGTVREYRSRECDRYRKRLAEPAKACRCIHFESRY